MRESAVDSRVVLVSAQNGDYLWRNNRGAFQDDTGRWIRYGLMNESDKIDKICKSSDRIGITSVIIQPHHVGQLFGVFTAIETKPSDWYMIPSDKRAIAQMAFHDIVLRAGGYAGFARNEEEYRKIVGK